jgi:hypothetical protein
VRRLFRRRRTDVERPSRATRGVYGAVGLLATLIDIVVGLVTLVIVIGILLVVLGANEDNAIVGALLDAAEFLVGPFDNVFERDGEKEHVAINWGIAVVVYFIVGRLLTSFLRRGTE